MNIFNLFHSPPLLSPVVNFNLLYFSPFCFAFHSQIPLWLISSSVQLYPAMTSRKVTTCTWSVTFKRIRKSRNFHGCTMWVVKKIFRGKMLSCELWIRQEDAQYVCGRIWIATRIAASKATRMLTKFKMENFNIMFLSCRVKMAQVSVEEKMFGILFRSLSCPMLAQVSFGSTSVLTKRMEKVKGAEALKIFSRVFYAQLRVCVSSLKLFFVFFTSKWTRTRSVNIFVEAEAGPTSNLYRENFALSKRMPEWNVERNCVYARTESLWGRWKMNVELSNSI